MKRDNTFSSLREQEKEARRNILIDSAEHIFSIKPFNRVTMKDIAEEAGVNPATIYRYFPDQQSLFLEAFLRNTRRINEGFSQIFTSEDVISLEGIIDSFLSYVTENPQFFRMTTYYLSDGDLSSELFKKLMLETKTTVDYFEKAINMLNPELDTRLISQTLYAAMNGVLLTFHNYSGKKSEKIKSHIMLSGKIIARMFKAGINSDEVIEIASRK